MTRNRRAYSLAGAFVAAAFAVAAAGVAAEVPGPVLAAAAPAQSAPAQPAPGAKVPSNIPPEPVPSLSAPAETKAADRVVPPGEVDARLSGAGDADAAADGGDGFMGGLGSAGIPRGEADVPPGLAGRVRKFIGYFQRQGRERFELWLARSGKYGEMMREILARYGLPGDLVYVALIESGFSPKAYSVARAAGPWQFIAGTARRYGLKVDWWTDERRDYEKSTHAAASYLKDLYGIFESWDLAAAAYNAGEGKIMRAVEKYKTEDYTELIRYRYLKEETKDYVPKMYAALSIAKEPEKYGFGDVKYQDPLAFDKVEVPGGTDLQVLGNVIGVPYEALREWNPEIRRFCTPPNQPSYELRVPKGYADIVRERAEEIRTNAKVTFILHQVRRGETLDSLSGKYKVPAEIIREVNGIGKRSLGRSAKLIIPVTGLSDEEASPGREVSPEQLEMAHMRVEEGVRRARARKAVKVRRGDTLSRIAKRLNVPVDDLAEANGLSPGARLRAGRVLRVPAGGGGPERAAAGKARDEGAREAPDGEKKGVRHVVRRGDTLNKVARLYGVTVTRLSEWNGINPRKILSEGSVLLIPAES